MNAVVLNPRKAQGTAGQGPTAPSLGCRDSSTESHLFWLRNCLKSHWTMKGHRRKKSSVGPESLRGQGRALAGGLC